MDKYLKENSFDKSSNSIIKETEKVTIQNLNTIDLSIVSDNDNTYSASLIPSTNTPPQNLQLRTEVQGTDPSDSIPFETPQEITVKRFRLKKR